MAWLVFRNDMLVSVVCLLETDSKGTPSSIDEVLELLSADSLMFFPVSSSVALLVLSSVLFELSAVTLDF